jgi:hypothetical protein
LEVAGCSALLLPGIELAHDIAVGAWVRFDELLTTATFGGEVLGEPLGENFFAVFATVSITFLTVQVCKVNRG